MLECTRTLSNFFGVISFSDLEGRHIEDAFLKLCV